MNANSVALSAISPSATEVLSARASPAEGSTSETRAAVEARADDEVFRDTRVLRARKCESRKGKSEAKVARPVRHDPSRALGSQGFAMSLSPVIPSASHAQGRVRERPR